MADAPTSRGRLSKLLHSIDSVTSRASVALAVAVLSLLTASAFVTGVLPGRWENDFWTVTAAITLAMVFVIQHTQTRHQAATQVKLDELVKGIPEADSRVVKVETASDDELHRLHARQLEHRVSAHEQDLGSA